MRKDPTMGSEIKRAAKALHAGFYLKKLKKAKKKAKEKTSNIQLSNPIQRAAKAGKKLVKKSSKKAITIAAKRRKERASKILAQLWQKGLNFLGTEFAILGGAMSWVSERNLVAAISNAGGFGVIACGSMPPHLLEKEIEETRKLTKKPFGVNLITMHPDLEQLIEVCIRQKRKSNLHHVVLAGGLPKATTIAALKNAELKVMGFAPAIPIARKLVKDGIDALIIEGMEAGGHIGPVSTSVLSQEILPYVREHMPHIPVFVAGGIGRGEAIAGYLETGASGVQLGTRFVCATESIAHPNFKRAFIKASAREALPSVQLDPEFPVIPVRALENKATKLFMETQRKILAEFRAGTLTKEEAQLKIEHFWAGALRKAVIDGDIENGSLMAGQSVGMVTKEQPTRGIVMDLVKQTLKYFERTASLKTRQKQE